jgi:acyl carrier protein
VVALKSDDNGDSQLQGWVVAAQTHVDEMQVKRSLKSMLPPYMIPSHIFVVEKMPLTANGKVDMTTLLAMEVAVSETLDLPQGPGEQVMLELWQNLLGHENIGVNDDFFMVGGHSLLATQLVNIVNENLAIAMPLQVIFEFATIRTLVEHLGELMGGAEIFEAVCEQYLELQNMSPEELALLEQSI